MKRGAEKVRSLISDRAAALMENSLRDRGFIVERGFRKLISLFAEMLENRGWQVITTQKYYFTPLLMQVLSTFCVVISLINPVGMLRT